jgi:hypothetical protein
MVKTALAAFFAALVSTGALAQDQATAYCRGIGARPNSADDRECRLLVAQFYSGDPFYAALARAQLWRLQHRMIERQREREAPPDFSQYGTTAAPSAQQRPGTSCVVVGNLIDCD